MECKKCFGDMKLLELKGNDDDRVGVYVCTECNLFEETLMKNQEKIKPSPLKRMIHERRK